MKTTLFLLIGFFFTTPAMAVTAWAPTNPNGDVNFVLTNFNSATGGILALFDDQNQNFTSAGLMLNVNDTVSFTQTGSGYTAANRAGNTTFLSDTYNFILGMSLDAGNTWVTDSFSLGLPGANAYFTFFDNAGQTLMFDVAAVPLQPVPLPAAFWLFATGLLGLIAYTRRKTKPLVHACSPQYA
ncbi:MAG: VPLPA-CTERM sorting domain-containing protein [Thiohalomonadales bacterium]